MHEVEKSYLRCKNRMDEATKKRLRAGRMLLKGKGCAEAALAVGVARYALANFGPDGMSKLHAAARQAQERSKTPLDHRRMSDACHFVVMS
jgi:hypothetical protein